MSVKMGSYKGHATITLDADGKYPFCFGLAKAKLLLANVEAVRAFVAQHEKPASNGGDRHDTREEDRMAEQCGLNGGGR